MSFLSRLTDIDPDEVSPVKRGANRRRLLLMKADTATVELDDMLAVPVEYEGALTDLLRKAGSEETTIEATVAGLRLLKAAEEDLPDAIREEVEKLGSQMYPLVNKPLNNMDGADKENEGANDDTGDPALKAETPPDDEPDADDDDGVSKEDADGIDVAKADLSTEGRKGMASRGQALPDGSFPIPNVGYLKRAIRAFGRAGDKPRAKAWITRRARALGRTDLLPEGWGGGNVNKEEGTVSEGAAAVAVPVPIKKDDGTWDLSGVPEESRPFYEDVLAGRDTIAKERDDLREEVRKAQDEIAEERDLRLEREFVAKAEGFKHVAAPDELGPVLKEIAGKIEPEKFEVLEKALAAAEERIAKSDLFKEVGRSGNTENADSPGDAWSLLEKAAGELVEKSTDLTPEQAMSEVLKTARGRELYRQYQAEV